MAITFEITETQYEFIKRLKNPKIEELIYTDLKKGVF
jgi:hypothetical protein